MNKTKVIYFLSAIVCIIGCYALNLSYSLFVETSEKQVVDATTSVISAALEVNGNESISMFSNSSLIYNAAVIPANTSEIVKLKVINTSSTAINYGISVVDTAGANIQLVEKFDAGVIGRVEASDENNTSFKEVLLYVTNPSSEEIEVVFKLDIKYATLNFDVDGTYIENSNIDTVNTVKTLGESILNRALNNEINDEGKTIYNDEINLNDINEASLEDDKILAKASDDYGTSYVFRGNVSDNYVSFAGLNWRVVRINGDGSVRLILDDIYTNSSFNSIASDNAHIGYMFGNVSSSTYDDTHKNLNNSTIKSVVDNFYLEKLQNYSSYLADTLFCGDKTVDNKENSGYGNLNTNYSSYNRLNGNSLKPTLICNDVNNYSRYTSIIDEDIISVNNDLSYPIGLLTVDEAVMAGMYTSLNNDYSYLSLNSELTSWWTMTPSQFNEVAKINVVDNTSGIISKSSNENSGVRPVINLKYNVIVEGNGTENSKYVVK